MKIRAYYFHLSLLFLLTHLYVPSSAFAHKLKMFVTVEAVDARGQSKTASQKVIGKVYYSSSSPLIGGDVSILALDGRTLVVLKTDDRGRFEYSLTSHTPIMIQSRSIDGHLVERTLRLGPRKNLTQTLKSKTSDRHDSAKLPLTSSGQLNRSDFRQIISSELTPLKEQISHLQNKIWLLEILGGLGILFGGFGIWMFLLAKRQQVSLE